MTMLMFGKIPTYQGTEKFELGVSDDKRALTLTFSDFTARVGGKGATVPVASRLFNFVAPLTGDYGEVEFTVTVGVLTLQGATATIVASINGQTKTADFPPNTDKTVEHTLKFSTNDPSECRLSVLLLAGRDSTNVDAEANVNVIAINGEILPHASGTKGTTG
jgi:hypothetical protein